MLFPQASVLLQHFWRVAQTQVLALQTLLKSGKRWLELWWIGLGSC